MFCWSSFTEVEIVGGDGSRIQSVQPTPNRPFDKIELVANQYSGAPYEPPRRLALNFSDAGWARVKDRRVRVAGSFGLGYCVRGETTTLLPDGSPRLTGAGRCTVSTVEDRLSEPLLKVFCESPRGIPPATITLRDQRSGRVWQQGLNSAFTYGSGPNRTWLSPLHRAQAFFHLTRSADTSPSSQWLVPAESVAAARLEITPSLSPITKLHDSISPMCL